MRDVHISTFVVILVAIASEGPAHAHGDSTQLAAVVTAVNRSADSLASLMETAEETDDVLQTIAQSLTSINTMLNIYIHQSMNGTLTAMCDLVCAYGLCLSPNPCKCDDGQLDQCQNPICDPVCVSGQCVAPNTCECDYGWQGGHCEYPICASVCGNGQCVGPYTCKCDDGWEGDDCMKPICEPPCIGKCRAPNNCDKCPYDEKMFMFAESNQCFKIGEVRDGWEVAEANCKSYGLVLAKPKDPVALSIYLAEYDGGRRYWVGAHGNGSTFIWQRDGEELDPSSPLWVPNEPEGNWYNNKCVALKSPEYRSTTKGYRTFECSWRSHAWPLCEQILE